MSGSEQRAQATDFEIGYPFIGLEISSRTPGYAVGGTIGNEMLFELYCIPRVLMKLSESALGTRKFTYSKMLLLRVLEFTQSTRILLPP